VHAEEHPAVHGLETVIEARYRTIMFLKFDLSGIDVVGKCTLNIPVTDVYYIDDHDGTIKPWVFLMRWADNNWSESTLTYSNNRTTVLGNVIGYWTVPRTTPQTIQIDVSDLVAEAITAEYDTFTLKMYTYDGWSDTEYYVKLGAHDGDSPAWLYFEN
jgi:hypothetical protein